MTVNGADKANSIVGEIDFLLFGSSATLNTEYSLTDRIRNINTAQDEVVTEIFKADPNWEWDDSNNTDLPIATTALIAARDNYGIPDATLVIHRVRIKDNNGDWVTLNPVDRRELSDSDMALTGVPTDYYKIGRSIFPIPVPDYGVAGGFELQYQRGANHYTISTTDSTPGFDSRFHRFLSVSAAYMYAIAHDMGNKIQTLTAERERIRTSIRDYYQTRSKDQNPKIKLKRRNVNRYGIS